MLSYGNPLAEIIAYTNYFRFPMFNKFPSPLLKTLDMQNCQMTSTSDQNIVTAIRVAVTVAKLSVDVTQFLFRKC